MVCINSMYVCIRQVGVVSSFPYVHKATTIASLGCSVNPILEFATSWASCYFLFHSILYFSFWGMHRGAFCKFPFRWIYYCGSNKSTGKETGKTHLCAVQGFECYARIVLHLKLEKLPMQNADLIVFAIQTYWQKMLKKGHSE